MGLGCEKQCVLAAGLLHISPLMVPLSCHYLEKMEGYQRIEARYARTQHHAGTGAAAALLLRASLASALTICGGSRDTHAQEKR